MQKLWILVCFLLSVHAAQHTIRLCNFGGGLDMWGALANTVLPGQTQSFYQQNQVEVQITPVFGSIQQFELIKEGVCDMCGTYTDNAAYRFFNFGWEYDVIAGTDQGANSGLVINTNNAPITDPSNPMTAIKGKSILVDGPLSGLVLVMYALSDQSGLTPGTDYSLVVAGATNFRIAYLAAGVLPPNLGGGATYATMSADPTTAQYVAEFPFLVNVPALSALPGPYQASTYVANKTYSRNPANAASIRAYLKSSVQAFRFATDPNNYDFMINYLMTSNGFSQDFATSYFCEFVLQPTGWNRDLKVNLDGICTIGTERDVLSSKFPSLDFSPPPSKHWIRDFVNLDHLRAVLEELDGHPHHLEFDCGCCSHHREENMKNS